MDKSEALELAEKYTEDDTHGYILGGREFEYGTDCSGFSMLVVAGLLDMNPYDLVKRFPDWSTRTMRDYMVDDLDAFDALPFDEDDMRPCDFLLKEIPGKIGHVVVYKGSNRIFGAEGNWDGKQGDSSGTEVCERSYYPFEYNYILRLKEDAVTDKDIENIAEKVADKVIMGTLIDGNNVYNRLLGVDNLTQANYKELHRTDDPTGRGCEMTTHEHVKWIGKILQEMDAKISALAADIASLKNTK